MRQRSVIVCHGVGEDGWFEYTIRVGGMRNPHRLDAAAARLWWILVALVLWLSAQATTFVRLAP